MASRQKPSFTGQERCKSAGSHDCTPGKTRFRSTMRAAMALSLISPTSGYLCTTALAADGCRRAMTCSLFTCSESGLAGGLLDNSSGKASEIFLCCLEEPSVCTTLRYPVPTFEEDGPSPKAPAAVQAQFTSCHPLGRYFRETLSKCARASAYNNAGSHTYNTPVWRTGYVAESRNG